MPSRPAGRVDWFAQWVPELNSSAGPLPMGAVRHGGQHPGADGTDGPCQPRAALIYQLASAERDKAIAEALAAQINRRTAPLPTPARRDHRRSSEPRRPRPPVLPPLGRTGRTGTLGMPASSTTAPSAVTVAGNVPITDSKDITPALLQRRRTSPPPPG